MPSRPTQEETRAAPFEAFEIRGTAFPLTVLRLKSADLEAVRRQLEASPPEEAEYFRDTPLALDLQEAQAFDPAALGELAALLRSRGFVPLGVCNASPEQRAAARAAGLASLPNPRRERGARPAPEEPAPPPPQEPQPASKAKGGSRVITQAVRSGQRIYARGGDLVVVGAVNAGAEVIADGNVHVYGPLRGRALAGAAGDTGARIFCQSLEAELVSIGGTYRLLEELPPELRGRPVQVWAEEERLAIEPL